MEALNCHFAEALCLGIGEYERDQCLPQAAADAENMAAAFRNLGCCNVISRTTQEPLTRQKIVDLVSGFVLRTKFRMQDAETTGWGTLLVALFVASHGMHAHAKELPLIVPADLTCSSDTEELIDLDRLLLNELAQVTPPRHNQRTCCVWIILDTCRSGPVTAWQCQPCCSLREQNADVLRGPSPLKTKLTPDFLVLLACDRGGWASDCDSLSSALVKSLQQDNISIREACEKAIGAIEQTSRGRQRPWMHQRAGPTFSNIRKVLPAQVQDQRSVDQNNEVECVPSWFWLAFALVCGFTIALLVLICFFSLFYYFKITGAENVAKGKDCPGASCFCTDCNHRNIYSNEKNKNTDFSCKLWEEGPTLNRCRIGQLLHVAKIFLALAMSRKSVCRLLGVVPPLGRLLRIVHRDGATPLDWCVVLVSGVNVLTSLPLPLQEPDHVAVVAYAYGILNFAFIAASISMLILIHVEFPGLSLCSCGQFVPRFTFAFLATALIGQLVIFGLSRAMVFVNAQHAGKQEMLFYAFHVLTGAVLALVGYLKSRGSQAPVAKKSYQLLIVSLCWMLVVLAWLITSHYNEELMADYHLLRVVAERVCNFGKIRLMVWFSEHSIRCTLLRRGSLGTAACRMHAAKVVLAENCQVERAMHATFCEKDQFHAL
ncbi:unnamed protein product [Cladocopium goreaui]|uniref:Peptidase C14 caspase domain-containing protein n=1 Tax=Cladocopium goreaui TaxID=2562237 RepID=A0A9P1CSW9_9DINO|nr:unnamed protein product [Cladocopium goreaui]